jgi:hypothetical protein|nr:hypothetical protein [Kofleriaceae bacterium]
MTLKRLAGFLLASALAACGPRHASYVKIDNAALGRVVVYRNGVAYYERQARVEGGVLTVSVPRDRVDDFLKSLTVLDLKTNQPLPVSIPRQQAEDGNYLVMKLQVPDKSVTDVTLTYVTEAPAWKPSYRVVVGNTGHVMLEGWAIVDNTSGEDWKGVRIGVGSSSALAFKFDLWSVRQVQRTTLEGEQQFAIAPPTGVSPYGGSSAPTDVAANGQTGVLADLDDGEIRKPEGYPDDASKKKEREEQAQQQRGRGEVATTGAAPAQPSPEAPRVASARPPQTTDEDAEVDEVLSAPKNSRRHVRTDDSGDDDGDARDNTRAGTGAGGGKAGKAASAGDPRVAQGDRKLQLPPAVVHGDQTIVIQSYTAVAGNDGKQRAEERANVVKNELVDQGVSPGRIQIEPKFDPQRADHVQLVAQAASPAEKAAAASGNADADAQPVGESNFENTMPMTVEKGSSAMVSMVRGETDGEVVYLFDSESERGNDHFAFRAVRFRNPTDSTLETGPVTVYGEGRFIGEGLTEPIPPKSSAVVPYALDRQIVVERTDNEDDHISKLETLQRGVLTAEVQHVKRRQLTLTNRMNTVAKVFVRHTVQKGWTLVDAPPQFERIGDAHLFEVDLAPNEVKHIEIAEATPLQRTLDMGADVTMQMMKVYVEAPDGAPALKEELKKVLAIHKELVDLGTEEDSLRERLGDYRDRMNELHAQIITLQAVKTGGDLMVNLKQKMKDISDRVQKTTIAIVDSEEKSMLARVRYQDALSELTLPDAAVAMTSQPPTK